MNKTSLSKFQERCFNPGYVGFQSHDPSMLSPQSEKFFGRWRSLAKWRWYSHRIMEDSKKNIRKFFKVLVFHKMIKNLERGNFNTLTSRVMCLGPVSGAPENRGPATPSDTDKAACPNHSVRRQKMTGWDVIGGNAPSTWEELCLKEMSSLWVTLIKGDWIHFLFHLSCFLLLSS